MRCCCNDPECMDCQGDFATEDLLEALRLENKRLHRWAAAWKRSAKSWRRYAHDYEDGFETRYLVIPHGGMSLDN